MIVTKSWNFLICFFVRVVVNVVIPHQNSNFSLNFSEFRKTNKDVRFVASVCSIFFLLISTINEGKMPNIRIQHYRRIKTKIETKKFGKKKDTLTPAPRFGHYRLIVSFISKDQTKSCWRKITKYVRMVIFHYCI